MIIMRESRRERERERERERDDVYLLKGERKKERGREERERRRERERGEGYIRRTTTGNKLSHYISLLWPPRGLIVPARAGGSREAGHARAGKSHFDSRGGERRWLSTFPLKRGFSPFNFPSFSVRVLRQSRYFHRQIDVSRQQKLCGLMADI